MPDITKILADDVKDETFHKRMRRLMRLNEVPRWSVIPVIKPQSVAEHTFGVMVMMEWLCNTEPVFNFATNQPDALRIALWHDSMEAVTGDMPSPTKKIDYDPKMSQESKIVKIADALKAI